MGSLRAPRWAMGLEKYNTHRRTYAKRIPKFEFFVGGRGHIFFVLKKGKLRARAARQNRFYAPFSEGGQHQSPTNQMQKAIGSQRTCKLSLHWWGRAGGSRPAYAFLGLVCVCVFLCVCCCVCVGPVLWCGVVSCAVVSSALPSTTILQYL